MKTLYAFIAAATICVTLCSPAKEKVQILYCKEIIPRCSFLPTVHNASVTSLKGNGFHAITYTFDDNKTVFGDSLYFYISKENTFMVMNDGTKAPLRYLCQNTFEVLDDKYIVEVYTDGAPMHYVHYFYNPTLGVFLTKPSYRGSIVFISNSSNPKNDLALKTLIPSVIRGDFCE